MKKSHNSISFIIVNYKSAPELRRCLSDLIKIPHAQEHEVIIVNNDTKKLSLPCYGFRVQKCIELKKNIGYGSANNIGLSHATHPFVCFLNPDTHSFSKNFFMITNHIAENMIVSPRINNENFTPQRWSNGEKISLLSLIKNNFGLYKKTWENNLPCAVYWVSGAALCGRTAFIKKIGGFDESFFLYFEDVDLCERVHHNGGTVHCIPKFSLIHTNGQSSKKTRKIQKRWYYKSQDLFFKKHFGIFHVFALRIFRLFHAS